jgi:predicted transposase YdaD
LNVDQITSLVEDKAVLAENLEHWAEQERQKGEEIGWHKGQRQTALNLFKLGVLTDEQIVQVTGLTLDEVTTLRSNQTH